MKDIVRDRKSYISCLTGITGVKKMTATISTSTRLTTPTRAPLMRRKTSRGDKNGDVEAFEQSHRALPKNFTRSLPVQDENSDMEAFEQRSELPKNLICSLPVHGMK
jgi:hypothetical protein